MGIIRRSKFPQKPPMIRYKDARSAVTSYLASPIRAVNPINAARALLQQRQEDESLSAFARDDAAHSIEVLDGIMGMGNLLGQYDFQQAPAQQPKLVLSGVEVSVRADLLVHGTSRGVEQIGAAVLRLSVDGPDDDEAIAKRRRMGFYVAALARLHVEQNITSNREPSNRLCMSIDVQHGDVFVTPTGNARRVSDLENACAFIRGIWPTVQH
jgi:hypothetical protein